MHRRVPAQQLRGSDPTLLEVQLSDLLRRPLGQVAPANMMDLVELADTEGRPTSLERRLQNFVDAVGRQISDIPNGRAWTEFLDELDTLEGGRVPLRFRGFLEGQLERDDRESERVASMLERWSGTDPEPFPLGLRAAKVVRAEAVKPRKPAREPSAAPREGRSTETKSKSNASGAGRAQPVIDIDRRDYLKELCIERLARVSSNGLGAVVLMAGVQHHAKERYPHVTPQDVTAALNDLKDAGLVRFSAGRWSTAGRW